MTSETNKLHGPGWIQSIQDLGSRILGRVGLHNDGVSTQHHTATSSAANAGQPSRKRKRPIETSNTEGRPQKRVTRSSRDKCQICDDEFKTITLMTQECCSSYVCFDCLINLISVSLGDQRVPRCPGVGCDFFIKSDAAIAAHLKYDVQQTWKSIEKADAIKASGLAIVCGVSNCGALMQLNTKEQESIKCTSCRATICTSCRLPMNEHLGVVKQHQGVWKLCPTQLTDTELQETIDKLRLKRCPLCHYTVEKSGGCNSITCKCGQMFCYKCGDPKRSENSYCSCNRKSHS